MKPQEEEDDDIRDELPDDRDDPEDADETLSEREPMMNEKTPKEWINLLTAAQTLLEAKENQMETVLEWKALRKAIKNCIKLGKKVKA